jgi:hypothetical protein
VLGGEKKGKNIGGGAVRKRRKKKKKQKKNKMSKTNQKRMRKCVLWSGSTDEGLELLAIYYVSTKYESLCVRA